MQLKRMVFRNEFEVMKQSVKQHLHIWKQGSFIS
jgi:hypothetical protein